MTTPTPTTGHLTTPDGTRLAYRAYRDQGGQDGEGQGADPPLLLLHGLAGHVGEWDTLLPPLLADGHRIVTYDARGHGSSTREPKDMTRAAAVQDALTVIHALDLAPVTLVGQSLGGHTALLTAAAHPDLVHSLVLIEAGPGGPTPSLPADIAAWLDKGQHPGIDRLDRATMLAAVAELATTAYWPDWTRVTCPTLLVRGAEGTMPDPEATEMLARRPSTKLTTIPEAGHDVHLDQPEHLYAALSAFLAL
ncbi:alpha/beta fold hydrolase [Streptomyces spongiae]|uniref:Alpha/beta fold hydrolase n=1 Tax=Streptomyces spongiae TaxID=565072 RepID=A0A5N8XWZ1_9ACTN|nr:alpha/beta hydrolase [Streptomyces spongiae]MPY63776.1 alpha/beta fold hydrolase [Streptomyces spongiae]